MFMIAQIVGNGTENDPYRPDIVGSSWQAIIPSNSNGMPRFNWALVRCADPDSATGIDLFKLPNVSLDMQVGNIPLNVRNAIRTKLDSLGINTTWITLDTTLREIVRYIGKHLNSNFEILGDKI